MRFNYLLLSDILKERREEKRLSKNRLAQYVGISQPEITRIENGIRTIPNIVTLINICEVLDIDFINLLKITGFVDRKNLLKKGNNDMKKYKVTARKVKEIEFEVEASNEEKAMEILDNILEEVDIFELKIPKLMKEFIDVEAKEVIKNDEEFEEDLEENTCGNCEYFCSVCGNCTYKD